MNWGDVGEWLGKNGGDALGVVAALLTGNAPAAIAAGAGIVSRATGGTTPAEVLKRLQTDPASLVRMEEIAKEREADVHRHLERMFELQVQSESDEHEQTQMTIRSGDNAEDVVVKRTRPYQSWLAMICAIVYVVACTVKGSPVDEMVFFGFLGITGGYMGLREYGKRTVLKYSQPPVTLVK